VADNSCKIILGFHFHFSRKILLGFYASYQIPRCSHQIHPVRYFFKLGHVTTNSKSISWDKFIRSLSKIKLSSFTSNAASRRTNFPSRQSNVPSARSNFPLRLTGIASIRRDFPSRVAYAGSRLSNVAYSTRDIPSFGSNFPSQEPISLPRKHNPFPGSDF
jgi:hypothetical protein